MSYIMAELIQKKKTGQELSDDEIKWILDGFVNEKIPDSQMSAMTMAICFKGLSQRETSIFTALMRDSGKKFHFADRLTPRVDKHSTGGVGDKTSLIIGPILAALKIKTPMIAGRGLGHTGGTLDKLESISGFQLNLRMENFVESVDRHYFSLMGQTPEVCPADRKLYALRDITSTVDSIELICASIMSKKMAEDLTGLVMDVKFGSGAFMKSFENSEKLGRLLQTTGNSNGIKTHVVLSRMDEPLGKFSGNALEVIECLDILENKKDPLFEDTLHLSLTLAGHAIFLANKAQSPERGLQLAKETIENGSAHKEFLSFVARQGGSQIEKLRQATDQRFTDVCAKKGGVFHSVDTEAVGFALVALGAGRLVATDKIDPLVGLQKLKCVGENIASGEPIYRVYGGSNENLDHAVKQISNAIHIESKQDTERLPFIAKVLT
jgi:pyrimidine-nucleoside phosphorylase